MTSFEQLILAHTKRECWSMKYYKKLKNPPKKLKNPFWRVKILLIQLLVVWGRKYFSQGENTLNLNFDNKTTEHKVVMQRI